MNELRRRNLQVKLLFCGVSHGSLTLLMDRAGAVVSSAIVCWFRPAPPCASSLAWSIIRWSSSLPTPRASRVSACVPALACLLSSATTNLDFVANAQLGEDEPVTEENNILKFVLQQTPEAQAAQKDSDKKKAAATTKKKEEKDKSDA